ncbi:MAG: hypothetical protein ABID54_14935 [Pseudomonadota bacterium]
MKKETMDDFDVRLWKIEEWIKDNEINARTKLQVMGLAVDAYRSNSMLAISDAEKKPSVLETYTSMLTLLQEK